MTRRALVVGDRAYDELIDPLVGGLNERGWIVHEVPPRLLATTTLAVTADEVWVDGEPLDVVVNRLIPGVRTEDGFAEDDADFADAEARSTLLHALALPGVVAVNRSDAAGWFAHAEWTVWRRRWQAAGLPVVPLAVGQRPGGFDLWLSWRGDFLTPPADTAVPVVVAALIAAEGLARVAWCAGQVVSGPASPAVEAAGRLFEEYGVVLAGIDVDSRGRLVAATTVPLLDAADAGTVAGLLAERLDRVDAEGGRRAVAGR